MVFNGCEVNPNLVLFSDRPVREVEIPRQSVDPCSHWGDDEGIQGDLVQEAVVTRRGKQVLAELFGNIVAEHTVT